MAADCLAMQSLDMDYRIHPPKPTRSDWRIGVVGSGFIVNECHLVAYAKAGIQPVAIASRTVERAVDVAARHHIPRVHKSVEDLLDMYLRGRLVPGSDPPVASGPGRMDSK